MAETKTKTKSDTSILRIIVSAFEAKSLDAAVKEIISNTERLEAEVRGPVPLPTKTKK
jgi:ribosomal protein S10